MKYNTALRASACIAVAYLAGTTPLLEYINAMLDWLSTVPDLKRMFVGWNWRMIAALTILCVLLSSIAVALFGVYEYDS